MSKRGPTPRPMSGLRTHQFGVYFTNAERARLLDLAIPGGTDELTDLGIRRRVAAYLRGTALQAQPPKIPEINRKAWAELARLAANLNQHQHAINEGRALPGEVDLTEIRAAVDGLRRELLGVRESDGDEVEGAANED